MTGIDAARELRRLLGDPHQPYRAMWERHGAAYRGRQLNHASVARVLAAHLADVSLLTAREEAAWPRSRRDWLRSRLSGATLSQAELELFLDAFSVTGRARRRLLLHLEAPPGSVTVPEVYTPDIERPDGLPDRGSYNSVRVVERHRLGPDGRPEHHRTEQTLRANVDGVGHYFYVFDSDSVTVHVERGGVAGEAMPVGEELWGVVITLDRTLGRGETCELVYETAFACEDNVPPELRRTASAEESEITLEVTFHVDRLPASVHQCTWQSLEDPDTMTAAVVELDGDHRVGATWTKARGGLVGFTWEWDGTS